MPTLNRKRLVLRAIRSCLDVDTEGLDVDIQIVMSDAGSTDGAWEAMQEAFGADERVTLVRSAPGSGPMENWLNAAQYIKGDYVTFVWSDDYIAPHFLQDLLPGMLSGATVAIGHGCVRDVDDNSSLVRRSGSVQVPLRRYLKGYAERGTLDGLTRPFSPACSLFSRAVFEIWIANARAWTHETALRREVLWRRAIGPDQLLYLTALIEGGTPAWMSNSDTAQFSVHADAISVSSSRLPFETGYWISALWLLSNEKAEVMLGRSRLARFAAAQFIYGLLLFVLIVVAGRKSGIENRREFFGELSGVVRRMSRRKLALRFWVVMPLELIRTALRLAKYRFLRGIRSMPAEEAP